GEPSIAAAWRDLRQQHVNRLLVLPLFPQYSGATVGTVMEAVFAVLRGSRDMPAVRTVHDYHDAPGYIDALATQVREHWNRRGRGRHLLLSFHGLPRRYVDKGDPYHAQCLETSRLLASALELEEADWSVSFQSRFGRAPWLQPYTDTTLVHLAHSGTGVDVLCPGFAADCLETLEEVDIRYRALFAAHHGQDFERIPALNASDAHLVALADIVTRELAGWMTPTATLSGASDAAGARPRHGW
ncbi:MAG TPA: ferrochelatase, partial [Nevskiaceae bacterium]